MTTKTPTRFEFSTPSRPTPRTPIRGRTPSSRSKGATPTRSRMTPGDRYIPSRTKDIEFARFKMRNRLIDENSPPADRSTEMLDKLLSLQGVSSTSSALGFSSPQISRPDTASNCELLAPHPLLLFTHTHICRLATLHSPKTDQAVQ